MNWYLLTREIEVVEHLSSLGIKGAGYKMTREGVEYLSSLGVKKRRHRLGLSRSIYRGRTP